MTQQQEVARAKNTQVARPLHMLVPLIKQDLQAAEDAAETAAAPHRQAAAEKLAEARSQTTYAEFLSWAHRNFGIRETQAQRYLSAAKHWKNNPQARGAKSINAALKAAGDKGYMPNKPRPQDWHNPIKETLNGVDIETLNRQKDALTRAQEREAQRKLALQLIDIGYKALATKLHPDKKGGSREAMTRLNQVRDRLKLHA